jgi:nitrogen-specific signal transduction histidine kinase/CheY-like chemotaxis protein
VRDRSAEEQHTAERLAFERALFQTQKLESLGVLAGGIAHDFNNLLVAILGNADLVLDDIAPDSPVRQRVQQMQTAARHAADLTRQLLAYSGKGRGIVQPLSLNDVIDGMAPLLTTAISRNVTLHLELTSELPAILGDVTQVRQVLMNLVTNAAEAVSSMGKVEVQTSVRSVSAEELAQVYQELEPPASSYVALVVRDQGCGMDEVTLQRIFEPFFTTKFTGRGLGLSAVRGIVRGHGGALHVHSTPGTGTTFTVLWPVLHEPVATTPRQQVSAPWSGRGVIIVIDDDAEVRAVAAEMLERCGYAVQAAENGPAGLALLDTLASSPAAILLDLMMPQMSGDEVFAQIRQRDRGVPVILMSGYDEQDVVRRFVGRGLGGFLQKPFTQYDLQDVLRQLVGSAHA